MRSLVAVVLWIACFFHGASKRPPIEAEASESTSFGFIVGDSRSGAALPGVRVAVVSQHDAITDVGTTDAYGYLAVPMSRLRTNEARAVLFCRPGYFCGAFRLDEADFFSYRERYIDLALAATAQVERTRSSP